MMISRFQVGLLLALVQMWLPASKLAAQDATEHPSAKWESKIKKFEEQDRKSPPEPGQVLFIGSSSIVGWNLPKAFPDLKALNRGFGGSEVTDSLHFAERIILPYKPRQIFLYAGDNDIGKGKSAKVVFNDFVKLAELIESKLPDTKLIFVAIKPSIKRWKLWPEMRRANDMVAGYARAKNNVDFADIAPATLGENGNPDPALFKADGLHLNAAGYAAWNEVIKTFLNH